MSTSDILSGQNFWGSGSRIIVRDMRIPKVWSNKMYWFVLWSTPSQMPVDQCQPEPAIP